MPNWCHDAVERVTPAASRGRVVFLAVACNLRHGAAVEDFEFAGGPSQTVRGSSTRSPRPDILIVDDDATLREGLIDLFRLEGRTAVGASSGGEALFFLAKGLLPGVILLDLEMPVMNGWDFLHALERVPDLPRIPIVVMSGATSDRELPPREADAGFFKKPINFDALLVVVNRHLPSREVRLRR